MLRSAIAWRRATTSGRGGSPNRWAKRLLGPQVLLDRHLPADPRDRGDLAVLGLEDREEAGLLRQPGEPDRVRRGRAPAERARHEHVEVARPVHRHRRARPSPRGRAGRRRSRSRRRGSRAPSRSAARSCPGRSALPGSVPTGLVLAVRAAGRRRAGALHAGVHVRLVVVTDEEHVVVALEHPREAAEADVDGAAVAALGDHADVVAALAPSAAAMPVATAGALPNSEWIHGSCQDDSGYGVEKTSRQPVAFAATRRAVGRPHRGVEHVPRAERLAAALAGTVARGDRVRRARSRACTVRCSGVEQPVAGREACRPGRSLTRLVIGAPQWAARRCRGRAGCSRRAARRGPLGAARARRGRRRDRGTSAGPGEPAGEHVVEQRAQRALRDRPAAEPGDDVVDAQPAARRGRAARSGRRCRPRRRRTPSRRPRHLRRAASARAPRRAARGGSSSMPSAPTGTPSSRSSSTTSSIVPSTEPSATTTVSASSRAVARGRARRTRGRTPPRTRRRSAGSASSACICFACIEVAAPR